MKFGRSRRKTAQWRRTYRELRLRLQRRPAPPPKREQRPHWRNWLDRPGPVPPDG
jgi:hypothetical protein